MLLNERIMDKLRILTRTCWLLLFTAGIAIVCTSQDLNMKVVGNQINGFSVQIYKDHQLLVTNDGEFSLSLSNSDLSVHEEIVSWTAANYVETENAIHLEKDIYLKEFDSNLTVKVQYEKVNAHVLKKTITLFQPSIPKLYYTLSQTSRPALKPKQFITFEHENFPGGFVHELFPSVGFVTPDNFVVGCLTEAGYKNQYTRTTRRRFSGRGGGMVGMQLLPDVNLMSVSGKNEQAQGNNYIRQTFGQLYNLDQGSSTELPLPLTYTVEGNATVARSGQSFDLSFNRATRAGINLIVPMKDQHIYTISFLAKGNTPVALKLYRKRDGKITKELEHGIKYVDNFPVSSDNWSAFKGSILLPYIENDSIELFLGSIDGQSGHLKIEDLTISEIKPAQIPYNYIPLGQAVEKVTYIFMEPWTNHRDFVIASQVRLAEGMGFEGSDIEKMLYANFQMLTWITAFDDFTPFNVPNLNYSPDMYNRDSFWSVVSSYNKALNITIWQQWGNTQTPEGSIGTIVTPYMGSVEAKGNEATIAWLMWALQNKRRFGVTLEEDKIEKAVHFVLNEFDEDRDGLCRAHFSMSQIDVIDYQPKTDRLSVNQGMFAIALRTIKELGFDISDAYIEKAEEGYRQFYDKERQHLIFDRDFPEFISILDLTPEFLSFWLFDRPLLTDEMVVNHLNQIPLFNKKKNAPHPQLGTTAPICIRLTDSPKGYSYMTKDYQPFGEFGEANYANRDRDGFYYNGGSWLMAEYCGYVAGLKHGWDKAEKMMENRLWAEVNLNPQMPYSKEFIPTQYTSTDTWWLSSRGLCWNVFILMANEVAGLRTPEMDPDQQ
jgi:hypothetical protein